MRIIQLLLCAFNLVVCVIIPLSPGNTGHGTFTTRCCLIIIITLYHGVSTVKTSSNCVLYACSLEVVKICVHDLNHKHTQGYCQDCIE